MLSMRIDSLVSAIVRQELQGKGRVKEALHFHFDLRLAHYTNELSYRESCGLHLLYHVNPGYTYISVFSAVTETPFTSIKEVKNWKHEITHDSCWNSIDVFSRVYFDMAAKINAALKEDGREEIAPKDMTEHNGFQLFGQAFDWVLVEIVKDVLDERNYRRILKVLPKMCEWCKEEPASDSRSFNGCCSKTCKDAQELADEDYWHSSPHLNSK